jgi:hypothetical protein
MSSIVQQMLGSLTNQRVTPPAPPSSFNLRARLSSPAPITLNFRCPSLPAPLPQKSRGAADARAAKNAARGGAKKSRLQTVQKARANHQVVTS